MNRLKQHIVNTYYRFYRILHGISLPTSTIIIPPKETLDRIVELCTKKTPGAYLRFGDGEVNILEGGGAIEQDPDNGLANEMKESFTLKGPSLLKSLMIHSKKFGASPHMNPGMHLVQDAWADMLLTRVFDYFVGDPIYSHAAFAYTAVYEKDAFIKTIRTFKKFPIVFVGNKHIPQDILKKLFGNRVSHIVTDQKNTYTTIDSLEQKILSALPKNEYALVILAAGPTSNAIQKRLIAKKTNTFSVDIGSTIDAFTGSVSRAWIEEVPGGRAYWTNLLNECNS